MARHDRAAVCRTPVASLPRERPERCGDRSRPDHSLMPGESCARSHQREMDTNGPCSCDRPRASLQRGEFFPMGAIFRPLRPSRFCPDSRKKTMVGFFREQREPAAIATAKTRPWRVAVSACGSQARVFRSRLIAFSRRNWTHTVKYCDTS